MKKKIILQHHVTKEKIQIFIEDLLGKGSFGSVYPCRIRHCAQSMAVKLIRMREGLNMQTVSAELQMQMQLEHKFVLKMLKSFSFTKTHFALFMQRADQSLEKYVMKKYPLKLSQPEALFLLKSLLEALQYLRSNKISHNDIKPQNILLVRGIPKLSDFGIAKFFHESGKGGTPKFMCPQKFAKQYKQDIRGDVFSLGVSIWYCLTGELVYDIQYEVLKQLDFASVIKLFEQRYYKALKERIARADEQLFQILLAMMHPLTASRPMPCELLERLPACRLKHLDFDDKIVSTYREEQVIQVETMLGENLEDEWERRETLLEQFKLIMQLLQIKDKILNILYRTLHRGEFSFQLVKGIETTLVQRALKWAQELEDNPCFQKFKSALEIQQFQLMKGYFQFKSKVSQAKSHPVQQLKHKVIEALTEEPLSAQSVEAIAASSFTERLVKAKDLKDLKRIISEFEALKDDQNGQLRYILNRFPKNDWIIEI